MQRGGNQQKLHGAYQDSSGVDTGRILRVVGDQRQFFHLALCLPELACYVSGTSKWEFFKSSKLNSSIFIFQFISYRLIFGDFCSTFSSIFFLLPPWEKYKTLQIEWTITEAIENGFLYVYMAYDKLQFSLVSQIIFYFTTIY